MAGAMSSECVKIGEGEGGGGGDQVKNVLKLSFACHYNSSKHCRCLISSKYFERPLSAS